MARLRLEARGAATLPCLALYHPAPNSYTGQDTLEIQLPGNPALLERALHALLDTLRGHDATASARLAEAGEFTQRAYTAGRLDLTRAEGVAATISAVSDAQLQAARLLRTGRLGSWAVRLVDELAQLLALVEAGIDFVDQDDVVAIMPRDLDDGLSRVEAELKALMQRSRSWSSLEALPWVVLAGPPNAGKSTLFNALLGHERAVVSDVAGTTRDVLAEPLAIETDAGERAEVMLVDVAGLDSPAAALDASMQHAARAALDRADLVLWVRPADDDTSSIPEIGNAEIIAVGSKIDAVRQLSHGDLAVSAHTGDGLDALRRRIAGWIGDRAVTLAGQMLALNSRHHDELSATLADLAEARAMLADQRDAASLRDMELIADRMRVALDHLASLGGAMTPDDVIGKVFATFCVGK